ncbi:MAG: 16S rRNA (cytosine(1402)-N(4))-methyltransferase RsmH [candidate division KSB1 bacterium]|nr:16S rRNA (cytosine(1402)-N(4))-methyltransferase RsmH [candidate division KSB1 bacterium]
MGDYVDTSEQPVFHVPVLLKEAVDLLVWDAQGRYVDATIGGGGHADEILSRLRPPGKLLGIDWDPDAIQIVARRFLDRKDQVTIVCGNFADLDRIAMEQALAPVHGVLFDLGVSSWQIDRPERGFSFDRDGPLDFRMDPRQKLTAFELVNRAPAEHLERMIREYGEERYAARIARLIVERRAAQPISTTRQLAQIVRTAVRGPHVAKSLARVFQAIRIAVNRELENLERGLAAAESVLCPGGRVVVISYHSLEDRTVKQFFRAGERRCVCPPEAPVCRCGRPGRLRVLTRRPIRPSEDEVRRNPRARSARLRAAEKVGEGSP